jgi:hypothetical protein
MQAFLPPQRQQAQKRRAPDVELLFVLMIWETGRFNPRRLAPAGNAARSLPLALQQTRIRGAVLTSCCTEGTIPCLQRC